MTGRPAHQVALGFASQVKPANQFEFYQQVNDPVNGHQSYVRVFLPYLLVYFGGCQVVVATGDGFQDSMTLWGKAVAFLS